MTVHPTVRNVFVGMLMAAVSATTAGLAAHHYSAAPAPAAPAAFTAVISKLDGTAVPATWPAGVPLALAATKSSPGAIRWEIAPADIARSAIRFNGDQVIVIASGATPRAMAVKLYVSDGQKFAEASVTIQPATTPNTPATPPPTPPATPPSDPPATPPSDPPATPPASPPLTTNQQLELIRCQANVQTLTDQVNQLRQQLAAAQGVGDKAGKYAEDLEAAQSDLRLKDAELESLKNKLADASKPAQTKVVDLPGVGKGLNATKRPDGRWEAEHDGAVYIFTDADLAPPAAKPADGDKVPAPPNPSVPWKRN